MKDKSFKPCFVAFAAVYRGGNGAMPQQPQFHKERKLLQGKSKGVIMKTTNMPRPEYPRPQFRRDTWMNLNGAWEYQTDRPCSGEGRGYGVNVNADFTEQIIVPFCRESVLSGIGDKDFCECVWYRRTIELSDEWLAEDRDTILHIGASDYRTRLWVNGKPMGDHIGGYVSFAFPITAGLQKGKNVLTLQVTDVLRAHVQPSGKQCDCYDSCGCCYTRTTGIWQTVWLENVPKTRIDYTRYYPDIERQTLTIEANVKGGEGMTLSAVASYEGKTVGEGSVVVHGNRVTFDVPLSELHLWEVGAGRLYDLTLTLGNDRVESYFGMRKIECREGIFYLNNKPVFQRLVLDQGFYPDGIYTAATINDLEADIDRSLAMGFNGARLHQKVFEPLFLSMCDRKGYIVWGEHANWGLDINGQGGYEGFLPEWMEIMQRDFNHPAIIGWCPLNETNMCQNPRFVRLLSDITRSYDTTRIYIDASGWTHIEGATDMLDYHDYEQDPTRFAEHLAPLAEGKAINTHIIFPAEGAFWGHVTFVSEYGGTRWPTLDGNGWGYGDAPVDEAAFLNRFRGLTEAIMFHPKMSGLCYTQLTYVEQELNGLYTYDRTAKFDPALIREVLEQKAAIETENE